jgi:predicted SAM-dependent methyltransferase
MGLKLHLGCGSIHKKGYVNIDIEKWCGAVDVVRDACDLSIYRTGSVEHIFTHALLEHIPPWNTMKALKEWHRVLEPRGTIQIEVPDLERIFQDWLVEGTLSEKLAIDNIFGGVSPNQRYKNQHHLTGFTYERLTRMMGEADFTDFKRLEHSKFHVILVVYARKPG